MRVLFFGGTGFVGRHAVAACLARGHEVTIVCRGLSDPGAFPGVARITGERTDPRCLAQLGGRSFDAVIDSCAYLPREGDSDPRVPWLLRRIAEGGEIAAPGDPDGPVQLVDARDLAAFLVDCAERRTPGVFNAVSPPLPARELYDAARTATRSDARFTWIPDELLVAHGVEPFSEAPFWLPRAAHPALRADSSRAIAQGLSFRPVVDTLRDEWSWMQTGWDAAATVRAQRKLEIKAGLSPERERALLAAIAR